MPTGNRVASASLLILRLLVLAALGAASGCASWDRLNPLQLSWSGESDTVVLGRNRQYVVVIAAQGDTLESLAERFLGDRSRSWVIADENGSDRVAPGMEVVIPLQDNNRAGIYLDGYQTVPILTYHRFGRRPDRLTVTAQVFDAQMRYLRDHDYRVIPLRDVVGFLQGTARIPRRAVVLTIDDGYSSAYEVAYPVLKKYGFPATIMVYTDYIGHGGLTWSQIEEMTASQLVSVQAHSKTHRNLTAREPGVADKEYAATLREEIWTPRDALARRLGEPSFAYAYPYGDFNQPVLTALESAGYAIGLTVVAGENPAFAHPYMLRRTMIFGDRDMAAFAAALQTFVSLGHR